MKQKILLLLTAIVLVMNACKKDREPTNAQPDQDLEQALIEASNGAGINYFALPLSNEYNKIPQDLRNPLNTAKVELGALLYHESGLALNPKKGAHLGTYSCATCHFASAGFQAGRHQAIADGGLGFGINGEGRVPDPGYAIAEIDAPPIRSPSSMNLAYQEVTLWNGQFGAGGPNAGTEAQWTPGTLLETNEFGYSGLETQAIAAINAHRLGFTEQLCLDLNYDALFDAAFPEVDASVRYSREYAGLAIGAYERTLLANQAPFQLWLRGNNNAMSAQEKRGAILFFGKAGCTTCHSGPALAKTEFHALGMKDLYQSPFPTYNTDANSESNLGRYSFTKKEEDKYQFKVPPLYNLADSPYYGHGASFTNLHAVVEYFNKGVKENPNVPDSYLSEEFKPLNLTDEEVDDLTAFLTNALRDPNLIRYQPLSVRSNNCIPNNDVLSKGDLGCN